MKGRLRSSIVMVLACVFVLGAVQMASASDRILNGGFEATHEDNGPRPDDWSCWEFSYAVLDNDNGPARTGERKLKLYGPWYNWGASGCGQDHTAFEGDVWTLGAWVMQSSIDPLQGGNRGALKLEYYDAAGVRISGWDGEGLPYVSPELTVAVNGDTLDTYVYHELQATIPAGVATVKALVLHAQPDGVFGGSVNFDDATFVLKQGGENRVPTVSEWGLVVMTLIGLAGGTMLFRRMTVV